MAAGSSLDISKFFKDEENVEPSIVAFMKKRRCGGVGKRNVLFMDYETDRMSFEVQLEKLHTPQLKQRNKNGKCEVSNKAIEEESAARENYEFINSHDLSPRTASPTQYIYVANSSPILHEFRLSDGTSYSPSDRRVGAKNYSAEKFTCGRQTSLQEFENTIEVANFEPTTSSSPISTPTRCVPQLLINTNTLPEAENIDPNNANCTFTNESCSRISAVQQSPHHNNHKITAVQKSAPQISLNCSSTARGISKIYKTTISNKQEAQIEVELQEETQNKNCKISNEINETQANIKDNFVQIVTNTEQQQVVVIADNHIIKEVTSQEGKKSKGTNLNISSVSEQSPHVGQIEDNLELTDIIIISDDEELSPKSVSQNVSEIPLNLAASATKGKKRLRKRSLHLHNIHKRRKYESLNKPTGVPLNGEEYGKELKQMGNREILDLAKINSMGQILPITDREPLLTLEEANEKQHHLDEQIEQELLKRNLNNTAKHEILPSDSRDVEPYNIRSTVTPLESFIDETSSDQIKFKGKEKKRGIGKQAEKPETLKQYLKVTKSYSVGKRRKRKSSTSKRSLYNTQQNFNHSDAVASLTEQPGCAESTSFSRLQKQNDFITTTKIVTPPPAITATCEIQNEPFRKRNDIVSDSRTTNESPKTNNNDDYLFKKPIKPAAKKRAENTGKSLKNVPEKESIVSSADLTDGGLLRRSKRGQVPRSCIPILNLLYQNELKIIGRYEELKKNRIKKQRKDAKTKNISTKSVKNKSSKRKAIRLSIAPENDDKGGSQDTETDQTTHSHMCPSTVDQLNNIFDQLKQNSSTTRATQERQQMTQQSKTKPFKDRVPRLKPYEINHTIDNTNRSSTSTNSDSALICWLKSINEEISINNHQQSTNTFEQMRISIARNLSFIDLKGLEYAFYGMEENANVGYLRFQPQQIKPRKKAKHFDLQFINLTGLFRIKINNNESILSVGDLVIVEKSTYYAIQNLSDDIGILTVIKI